MEWTITTSKLPPEGERILILDTYPGDSGPMIYIGHYWIGPSGEENWSTDDGDVIDYPYSWMPLPELPKVAPSEP